MVPSETPMETQEKIKSSIPPKVTPSESHMEQQEKINQDDCRGGHRFK